MARRSLTGSRSVSSSHRIADQAQYIEQPLPATADANQLDATINWAITHLNEPLKLERQADTRA